MRRRLYANAKVKHKMPIICTELERFLYMGFCDTKDLDAIVAYDTSQAYQLVIGSAFDILSCDIDPRTMLSWMKELEKHVRLLFANVN